MEALSHIGISYINISIDSFNPDLYEEYRANAKHAIFMNNLKRLATCFAAARHPPSLHYITLAFKTNIHEIPSIIDRCANEYLATAHEVRFPTIRPANCSDEWARIHWAFDKEREILSDKLSDVVHRHTVCPPQSGPQPGAGNTLPPGRKLWIRSDGSMEFYDNGVKKMFHLDEMESPYLFFLDRAKPRTGVDSHT